MFINFCYRSESPTSSICSSPPISPGCEDQNNLVEGFDPSESFKRPIPPEMRHQAFPPQFYNMYQPQLLLPNNSAFHRPLDGSGKPMSVSNSLHLLASFNNWIAFFYLFPSDWLDPRLCAPSFKFRAHSSSWNFLSSHNRSNGWVYAKYLYWFLIEWIHISLGNLTLSINIQLQWIYLLSITNWKLFAYFHFHTWLKNGGAVAIIYAFNFPSFFTLQQILVVFWFHFKNYWFCHFSYQSTWWRNDYHLTHWLIR